VLAEGWLEAGRNQGRAERQGTERWRRVDLGPAAALWHENDKAPKRERENMSCVSLKQTESR
jgi:hypothetical protein